MIRTRPKKSPPSLSLLNGLVTAASVTLCALALPLKLPGMTLAGIGPHWLLAWVVAWSIKRDMLQGILGGIAVGLLQDSLTAPQPTHVIGLALVGLITGRINKKRLIAEEFVSVALIVFGMAALVEVVMALQLSWIGDRPLIGIWERLPQVALSSAILSSLWTPVVYYPLNLWWDHVQTFSKSD
jgi:rod shape-determining protein MreD